MKIKNEEDFPYMKYQIITMLIMVIIIVISIIFGLKSYFEKQSKISKARNEYWYTELKRRNINKVSLVLEDKRFETNDHGDSWAKVKKMYVNDIEVNPETVYSHEKFVFKHCDGNYYLKGLIRNIDSIIYEFFPEKKYYKYNNKKQTYERAYINVSTKRYSNVLPKCED